MLEIWRNIRRKSLKLNMNIFTTFIQDVMCYLSKNTNYVVPKLKNIETSFVAKLFISLILFWKQPLAMWRIQMAPYQGGICILIPPYFKHLD